MVRQHQPGPGLRACRLGQPTVGQTCSRKALRSRHRPSLIMPPKLKVPAYSDPVKLWSLARMIGSVFFFLQENPLRDCHLRTQQTLRRRTRNYVRACYLRPNSVSPLAVARNICHVGTKSARPFIAPSFKPQQGTDCDRTASSLLSQLDDEKQEGWQEAINSIDSSHSIRKACSTINKF